MDDCSLLTPRQLAARDWLAREAYQEIDIDQKYPILEKWSQLLAAAGRCPRLYFTKYG